MKAPASPEEQYFRQIEDTFIRLRGTPFLLSPGDWRLAQGWYEDAIPVELVCRALEELFARRAERGEQGKVQSLRYCASAVENAWRERRELGSVQVGSEAYALEVEPRLARLAAALPPSLPQRAKWSARILEVEGAPRDAEARLAELDAQLVAQCVERLSAADRRRLESEVDASLIELRDRMSAETLAADRARLLAERARSHTGLPLLSLFSPDARQD